MSSGGEEVATDLNADGKQAQKKKKTAPSLFSPGDLVWAKVSGFKFWAGKVHLSSIILIALIAVTCIINR